MIDVDTHDTRARNESGASTEVFIDTGNEVPQSELLAVAGENSFPQRGVVSDAGRSIETLRALEGGAIHVAKHDAAVDIRDAVVVISEHAVGVRRADSGSAAKIALRTEDVVERPVAARRRQASIIGS